ncbi:ATP synthase F1 subunit delta [Lactobacillus bombicola]|uniref:ATP synthase subunit delta n=1 Tax=Lactobacillus bombicola TaxID=1505723 RepID=A0A396SK66_9LACO|nr:ATP synthase F1 subunit delta [Lactobacillus bombicola]RHW49167.1 F0F1 ATP synthase subunit delta [Lactobacillus bombicola]RHW53374.1 F0F1 ATP synthase subunit delta [Lactobacillus bombicola]RHW54453.1 F0F1 ATP synthase subunit delta [Lactobacillus bombicola]
MALSKEEIAARYGTALFDYAQDMHAEDTVHEDLVELLKAISTYPQILKVFSDPIFNSNEKRASLAIITKGLSQEVRTFLKLLLEYNHFLELPDIIMYYNDLYNKDKHVTRGLAITAVKLTRQQLKQLGDSYAQKYGFSNVELENQVDESIIGGVILKVGDYVIDGSVKNKLKKIRAQLINKD